MEPEQTEQPRGGGNTGVGIRVVGSRIYDPANGKSCHQCRQKTRDFTASCKNTRNGKPCVIKFCHTCLLNRYGEDAQQVELLDDWSCPKCQGKCNCSLCRKKQGQQPTGNLAREAKAFGFRSVSEYLGARAAANLDTNTSNEAAVLPPKEEAAVSLPAEPGKENSQKVEKTYPKKTKKTKREGLKEISNDTSADDACQNQDLKRPKICSEVPEKETKRSMKDHSLVRKEVSVNNGYVINPHEKVQVEIPLLPGTQVKEILGIEFPHEDVGNALQFLEFCRVFGKALDMKKGEAEAILRELIRKRNLRRGENTVAVQFQIRLLILILIDSGHKSPSLTTTDGKNSWLKALGDLASQSALVLKDFPLEMLNEGYGNLSLSHKLSLLNFICDEVLCTEKVRGYIEDENSKIAQVKKEAKVQVEAAKEKEKSLKQKLQEEIAKTVQSNGDPVSFSKKDALLLKLRTAIAQAHSEMLEAKGKTPKMKGSDAVRTEPEFVDGNGQAFWKLRSYDGEDAVLLQDIKIQDEDGTAIEERWFVYGPEKKHEIYKYISSRLDKGHSKARVYSSEVEIIRPLVFAEGIC
ncbi:uncharacterized protein LOC130737560 [Lotus japonicus]|uniref:uncharacterized protein LOC130737560 n=1 Tax=Lotus japonicus TaxID=34305 RepID=UPI00258E7F23|nr:uncharacterized protein LOC130737560 [Lotus japonicus]